MCFVGNIYTKNSDQKYILYNVFKKVREELRNKFHWLKRVRYSRGAGYPFKITPTGENKRFAKEVLL